MSEPASRRQLKETQRSAYERPKHLYVGLEIPKSLQRRSYAYRIVQTLCTPQCTINPHGDSRDRSKQARRQREQSIY